MFTPSGPNITSLLLGKMAHAKTHRPVNTGRYKEPLSQFVKRKCVDFPKNKWPFNMTREHTCQRALLLLQRALGWEQIATWDEVYTSQSTNHPIIRVRWKVLTHRTSHKIWMYVPAMILSAGDKDKSLPSRCMWENRQPIDKPLTYEWGSFRYQ